MELAKGIAHGGLIDLRQPIAILAAQIDVREVGRQWVVGNFGHAGGAIASRKATRSAPSRGSRVRGAHQ